MENVTESVHAVTTRISNLPQTLRRFSNTKAISINILEETKEYLEGGQTGPRLLTSSSSYRYSSPLILPISSFVPSRLARVLRHHRIPHSAYVATKISTFRYSRPRRTPFLISVDVHLIKEIRHDFTLPSSRSFRGDSRDVFTRLLKEPRVDEEDLEEDATCPICFDELSMAEYDKKIIRMPRCLHLFHQQCIFEWLCCNDSCPLCRRVPYEEDGQV